MGNIFVCCCPGKDAVEGGGAARPAGSGYGSRPYRGAFGGQGHTLGGGGVDSSSDVDARQAAAAAALERHSSAQGAGATDRDKKMLARRKKDELVGKIAAHYLQLHRDAPIGLSASTLDQLKKHYDHIKSQSGKETAVGSATQV